MRLRGGPFCAPGHRSHVNEPARTRLLPCLQHQGPLVIKPQQGWISHVSAIECPAALPAVAGLQGNLPGVPEELPSMAPAQLPQQLPEGLRGRSSFWTLATGLVYGLQPDALFVVSPVLA